MKKNNLKKLLKDNGVDVDKKDIDIDDLKFDADEKYINPGKESSDYKERRAYNNLKRTLLRKLITRYGEDHPSVQKVHELID